MLAQKFIFLLSCFIYVATTSHSQKINGISINGPSEPYLTQDMFEELASVNANWIGIVPEKKIYRHNLALQEDHHNAYWGQTIDATIESIKLARKAGLQIFIKPHVVLEKGHKAKDITNGADWRGAINPTSEADWQAFEQHYEDYMLTLVKIAADHNVELFGIGTELKSFVEKRPQFWFSLIQKIREHYSGDLIYCANWDEYEDIPFWNELDFIGIDSYFPINKQRSPTVKKTKKNWTSISRKLEAFSRSYNKQIVFTEFGYRNVPYAGARPWTHDRGDSEYDYRAQANLYEALFQTFWSESWIAGGFSWKWAMHKLPEYNTTFSVQDKPALVVLRTWYQMFSNQSKDANVGED